jgi:hypothetical protein
VRGEPDRVLEGFEHDAVLPHVVVAEHEERFAAAEIRKEVEEGAGVVEVPRIVAVHEIAGHHRHHAAGAFEFIRNVPNDLLDARDAAVRLGAADMEIARLKEVDCAAAARLRGRKLTAVLTLQELKVEPC